MKKIALLITLAPRAWRLARRSERLGYHVEDFEELTQIPLFAGEIADINRISQSWCGEQPYSDPIGIEMETEGIGAGRGSEEPAPAC
jgi:hypothetical protein